jgi:hypothetical protein
MALKRTKIWSWVPTGPETKNDCAGEGQKEFAAMLRSGFKGLIIVNSSLFKLYILEEKDPMQPVLLVTKKLKYWFIYQLK